MQNKLPRTVQTPMPTLTKHGNGIRATRPPCNFARRAPPRALLRRTPPRQETTATRRLLRCRARSSAGTTNAIAPRWPRGRGSPGTRWRSTRGCFTCTCVPPPESAAWPAAPPPPARAFGGGDAGRADERATATMPTTMTTTAESVPSRARTKGTTSATRTRRLCSSTRDSTRPTSRTRRSSPVCPRLRTASSSITGGPPSFCL
mmetsp:Transcript_50648/g.93638  ORF Transcript_50648/g.93638 Transcript_50648/m.93638 type:complete len:204 (+) Transcript_50648:256-867(+)